MKKILVLLFGLLCLGVMSCGNDKDEPQIDCHQCSITFIEKWITEHNMQSNFQYEFNSGYEVCLWGQLKNNTIHEYMLKNYNSQKINPKELENIIKKQLGLDVHYKEINSDIYEFEGKGYNETKYKLLCYSLIYSGIDIEIHAECTPKYHPQTIKGVRVY